ncbi:MAG: hypothetical protein AAF206_16040, partial [Bacteroidota bacterium]
MTQRLTLFLLLLAANVGLTQTLDLPVDFESATISYTFTDFNGGQASVIANPQSSGINTSANVGQMVKNTGATFGGSFLTFPNPIDFSTNKLFKVKVFSPAAGRRMLLKVENGTNGAIAFEREDTSTVANAWETFEFDFSAIDASQSYSKMVFIFDNGIVGDGSANFTWLFDDIELVMAPAPALSQIDLPVTFEDTTVDYSLTDFGGNSSSLVSDPNDATNMVARSVKTPGAQLWAGTT